MSRPFWTVPLPADLQRIQDVLGWRTIDLQRAPVAENTRRAMRSHMASWLRWCVATDLDPNVASAVDMVAFVAHLELAAGLCAASIAKRVQAVGRWHHYAGKYDPTDSPLVKGALTNLQRDHAGEPIKKARPILPDELVLLVGHELAGGELAGTRNAALFALLYAAALRGSEAVALNVQDVDWSHTQGIVVRIRRGKTDQLGAGRSVPVYRGKGPACPVTALERLWTGGLKGLGPGPVFRRVRGERFGERLAESSLRQIVADGLSCAGLAPSSSHGFRRGAATRMAAVSSNLDAVATLLRHSSVDQARAYVDASNPWARVPDVLGL